MSSGAYLKRKLSGKVSGCLARMGLAVRASKELRKRDSCRRASPGTVLRGLTSAQPPVRAEQIGHSQIPLRPPGASPYGGFTGVSVPTRLALDVMPGRIADEVTSHLNRLVSSHVTVTLEGPS